LNRQEEYNSCITDIHVLGANLHMRTAPYLCNYPRIQPSCGSHSSRRLTLPQNMLALSHNCDVKVQLVALEWLAGVIHEIGCDLISHREQESEHRKSKLIGVRRQQTANVVVMLLRLLCMQVCLESRDLLIGLRGYCRVLAGISGRGSRSDFRKGQEMKQSWAPVQVENRITECTLTSSDL